MQSHESVILYGLPLFPVPLKFMKVPDANWLLWAIEFSASSLESGRTEGPFCSNSFTRR
jgi:hypothetical protein